MDTNTQERSMFATEQSHTVKAYEAVQLVECKRYPIWTVDYTDTRGTRKRSSCKFNHRAGAERHGRQLVGLVSR